jgi:ligand-binding sensor protein
MLIIDPLLSERLKRGFSELTGVPQIAAISGQNLLRFCVLHKSASSAQAVVVSHVFRCHRVGAATASKTGIPAIRVRRAI